MNPTGSGVIIAQIAAQVSTLSSTSGLEVLVQDTNFTNHTISEQMSNVQAFNLNAFTAFNLKHLKIINCKFAMNKQTALQALDSTLYFGGHVIFSGNNGRLGGTLMLQGGSTIYLMPHTYIQIVNNHAKRGGGIYIDDGNSRIFGPCFFQLMDLHYPYSDIDSVVGLHVGTKLFEPCKRNVQYTRVFVLLQPLPGNFRSNDVTSGSLPVT